MIHVKKNNCPKPSPQLNCAISKLWTFHICKGYIEVLLVDLTTNKMVTNTLFTLTYKQDELGKSTLFIFVKSRITPGRTSMSHYMLDNFRIYKDSSPECWSYFFFARRSYDEIKWWKQTCLDFNNNHCSCNICFYTFVGLCFDVCGSTLSTKNLEEQLYWKFTGIHDRCKKNEKKNYQLKPEHWFVNPKV